MRRLIPVLMTAAALATTRAQAQRVMPEPPKARSDHLTHEQFRDWSDFNAMGRGALAKRNLPYAEYLFKRAIELARVEADTDPRLLARSYGDLAWVLHGQGRDEDAEPLAEWALVVRERYFGRESMQAGQTAYTLGMIEVDRGKLDEAQVHLEQSLAACEAGVGPNHPFTADALDDLATVLVLRRSYDRARPMFERALKVFRGINPDHVGQYVPLDGLATIDLNQGKYPEAEARLDEASKALDRDRYANPAYHAQVLGRRADALRKIGRAEEAKEVEAKAKEVAARPAPPPQAYNPRGDTSTAANGRSAASARPVAPRAR
jgi:tetratricopeptide (TPR) repeat protein